MTTRRQRLVKGEGSYESLRSSPTSNHQSTTNILVAGLFAAHLIEREYSVYMRINANQELVIRIYDSEDKYELIIYPREDARELVVEACSKLGGKSDMQRLIGLVHQLTASLEGSGASVRSSQGKTP